MTYITHQTPTQYQNRHSDWYNGVFAPVCHAAGLAGEIQFYAHCERQATEIATFFSVDFLGILSWLRDWLINIWKNVYAKNYVDHYDSSALQACKMMEQFDWKASELLQKIQDAYDNAVAQSRQMVQQVSDYITGNLDPRLQDAQNRIDDGLAKVNDAVQQVTDLQNYANGIKQNLDGANSTIGTHTQQINDLYEKVKAKSTLTNPLEPIIKIFEK